MADARLATLLLALAFVLGCTDSSAPSGEDQNEPHRWESPLRRGALESLYFRAKPDGAWHVKVTNVSQARHSEIAVLFRYADGTRSRVMLAAGESCHSSRSPTAALQQLSAIETQADVGCVRWSRCEGEAQGVLRRQARSG